MNKNLLRAMLAAGILSGCNNLEQVPLSSKSVEGFYKTEAHINQAIIGCYTGLRTVWINGAYSYQLTESRSDNTFQGLGIDDDHISRFEISADLPVFSTAWSNYYTFIDRSNRILEALGNVDMTEQKRRQYEGEAKFMRAMFYFDLVRLFGGVPKVTASLSIEESYQVPRSSVEEIYDQIVSDLSEASGLLPDTYENADKGRVTKWAGKAYLGKVYVFRSGYPLKKQEWANAVGAFEEVINSGRFEFFANYADNYAHANEGGKQQVFSIQYKSGAAGNGNPFPTRNAPNDIAPVAIGQGGIPFGGSPLNLFVAKEMVAGFENGDKRKDTALRMSYLDKSGTFINIPFCQKYQNGPVAGASDWDIDWIAMSYTDVLMLYAESLNEIGYQSNGKAFEILNNIRVRAGLPVKTQADVPDQQRYRLWMENERRFELCFENQRWFDLVRTDRALDVMKAFLSNYGLGDNVKSRDQYLYPIPQQVINTSPKITQNPGY